MKKIEKNSQNQKTEIANKKIKIVMGFFIIVDFILNLAD